MARNRYFEDEELDTINTHTLRRLFGGLSGYKTDYHSIPYPDVRGGGGRAHRPLADEDSHRRVYERRRRSRPGKDRSHLPGAHAWRTASACATRLLLMVRMGNDFIQKPEAGSLHAYQCPLLPLFRRKAGGAKSSRAS